MNSLLFSFPGTPIIYYGDEIGMGDNIYLGDRNGVRTPMQWTSDRNGGFSRCDPARLFLPVIMDPVYGHQSVNVEAQQRSPSSFLSWMKRLIGVRRSNNAFSRGTLSFIRPANRTVLAYVRQYENDTILCVANLSRSAQAAQIDLSAWKGRVPMEMLGRTAFPPIGEEPYLVTLAPYGFFWFLLGDQPEAKDPHAVPREFTTLVWTDGSNSLIRNRERHALEHDVLPHFLLERRWFAEKAGGLPTPKLQSIIPLEREGSPAFVIIAVPGERQAVSRYLLPLAVKWTRLDRASPHRRTPSPRSAAARARAPWSMPATIRISSRSAAGHAYRRLDCPAGLAAGVLSDHRLRADAGADSGKDRRAEPRAVQHHRDRGLELRREDVPQAQRRHSPRDRDRALPDRAYRLPERP